MKGCLYVAYRDGVIWNVTNDEEAAQDWLDRGVVECVYQYVEVYELERSP